MKIDISESNKVHVVDNQLFIYPQGAKEHTDTRFKSGHAKKNRYELNQMAKSTNQ